MEFILIVGFIALIAFLVGRKSNGKGGAFEKDSGRNKGR